MNSFGSVFYLSISTVVIFLFVILCNLLIWIFIINVIKNFIKRKNSYNYFKNNIVDNTKTGQNSKYFRVYNDVSKNELEKFNIDDINILKNYLYDIFVDFESAYNNLDYNLMKLLSTKQLYQKYYTGISLDLKIGNKKIISNIVRKNVVIFELDSTIAKQIVSAMIEISYITYKIDKNGKIISGNRYNPITEKFEIVFRKDFESKEVTQCINCGAEVSGKRCEFCRTNIKDVKFKISSIRKIIE